MQRIPMDPHEHDKGGDENDVPARQEIEQKPDRNQYEASSGRISHSASEMP
jgi:hypothetical protein